MTEKDLWKKIRSQWPGHAVRTEASEGGVEPGFPDSILSSNGRGFYVELKIWPEPLQPLQLPWHIDATDRGAGAEVWCWVDGLVWCGPAETYDRYVKRLAKPKNCMSLDLAISRLLRILHGDNPVV